MEGQKTFQLILIIQQIKIFITFTIKNMKDLFKNPVIIIGGSLILLITLILYFSTNASAQEKPKPDSIQVYTFTILPANFNTANKILTEKFLKNGTVSDTVLLQNAMQMLFSNGKAVKIVNPDKQKEKLITPKK